MVGHSTDIAKEIGDLQGKTAAIGAIACSLKGEDGPRCTDRPDARACVPSAGVFASLSQRASRAGAKTAATSLLCGPIRRLVAA
jgi:hypothetical protein